MDNPVSGNWNVEGDAPDGASPARPRARPAPPGIAPPAMPPPLREGFSGDAPLPPMGDTGLDSFDDYGNDSFDDSLIKDRTPDVLTLNQSGTESGSRPSAQQQDDLMLMDFSLDKSMMKNTEIHKYAEAAKAMSP
eukprot:7753899-Pyramimonas_sp.AAC.1